MPTASVTVEGNTALNRVRWAHSGREIAVGDSDGQVLVYDIGEVRVFFLLVSHCSVVNSNAHSNAFVVIFVLSQQIAVPRNDEWTRFVRTLAEINENRDENEELAAQRLAA